MYGLIEHFFCNHEIWHFLRADIYLNCRVIHGILIAPSMLADFLKACQVFQLLVSFIYLKS